MVNLLFLAPIRRSPSAFAGGELPKPMSMRLCSINHRAHFRMLLFVLLSCLAPTSYATGPSSAQIYIKPITYNDQGVVLFKAHQDIDYLGAPSDRTFSYWWLAVSVNGVWEEVPHKILKQPQYTSSRNKNLLAKDEKRQADFWKAAEVYLEEFTSELDWDHPPKSLLPLIKKYGFKPQPMFNENEGKGAVTWSGTALCMGQKCTINTTPQRTLGKRFSREAHTNYVLKGEELVEVKSEPIQSIFHHAGVALFRNGNYKLVNGKYEANIDLDDDSIGALFNFYKRGMGIQIIDYDYVDAISIVPKSVR